MTDDAEVRTLGWTRMPVGDGLDAICFERASASFVVPTAVGRAVEELATFRTLEAHAAVLTRAAQNHPFAREVPELLARLRAAGALVSVDEVVTSAREKIDRRSETLRAVAFPTHDRPEELERAVRSYVRNARDFQREIHVTVSDDGERSDATRAVLQRVRDELDVEIRFVDANAKRSFARALAEASRVDASIVDFALFDVEGCGEPIGANRNALLLAHVDEAFLSADDDTICAPSPHPTRDETVRFRLGEPTDWWFHPDRATALAAHPEENLDVFGAHEKAMQRTLVDAVAERRIDLRGASMEMIRALLDGTASIGVTLNGVLGDSGAFANVAHLGFEGQTRERMMQNAETFEHAMRAREVLRVAPSPTIAFGVPCMGTMLAFDDRTHPPFFPVLRNEDGMFGAAASICAPERFFLHLPFALRHEPRGARRTEIDAIGATEHLRFCDSMMATILGHRPPAAFDPPRRMQSLATYLRAIGEAPARVHREHVRDLVCGGFARRIGRLQRMLETTRGTPAYWAEWVRAHVRGLRAAMSRPDGLLPRDLARGRDVESTWTTMRTLMRRYGELLDAWPRVLQGARELRAQGITLARRL